MRTILVVMLLLLSSTNMAIAEYSFDEKVKEDSRVGILSNYSKSVQSAFARVGDMTQYSEYEISNTNEWLIITNQPMEKHQKIFPDLIESEPVTTLRGTYIWSLKYSHGHIEDFEELLEYGKIESFSPMIIKNHNPRYIPNDPYFSDQWHLQNTGQTTGGVVGEDINVTSVWNNYNGSGIVISVIDDGLDHSHPDIDPNYSPSNSYDWCNDDPDPSPQSFNGHGTAAAGVAAAVGDNGIDVTGAAYGATLAGSTLIACGTSDQMEADALSFQMNDIDIYTNSWGPADDGETLEAPGPITLSALENGAYNGRSGLGNIYTWAAGNGLESDDNANYDGYANSRYTIAVTAITHAGEQSYYAEPGANILVAAHSNGDGEGITTTDIEGSGGYDSGNVTNNFGGTSSATPLAAGVIALILEANGNLTWRDIQYILVQSSRVNDPNDSSWEINGAGLNVSHKYGFGAIDAGAAVSLAENWTNVNMESNFSYGPFSPNTEITDNDETWNEFSVNITADIKIESIDIITDITHTSRGDLDIVLVSPSGKESWLAESRGDNGNGYSDWLFNTVHHWGEDAVGEWKLKMRDTVNSDVGTLNTWEIVIHGVGNFTDTDGDGVSDFSDTDDDGDGWPDIDEDACGTESLNLSSVPTDTDNDTICNNIDTDDDGDGWPDIDEDACGTESLNLSSVPTDTDNDTICNNIDTDDDGDGWSDIDEDACGTESLNLSSVPQDLDEDGTCNYIDLDDDGDGLSDNNETEVYNTDPYDPDMDGDGLTDYEEIIIYGTKADEVDSDSDGLDDYEEVIIYNTNPLSQDTDDDGLLDIEEINIGTNPNIFDADSDNDSFYHFEDCNDLNSNINPNIIELLNNLDDNCNDQIDEGYNLSDFDNDGLFDWEEYHIYGTNYTNHDTDGDGLNDSKEVYITFTDPLILDLDNDLDGWYWFEDCDDNMSNKYPGMLELLDGIDNDCDNLVDEYFWNSDSDTDGLTDYEEYHNYSTDPLDGDSDNDGLPDGVEINSFNSNPNEADIDYDSDGWYEFQDCDDYDFERAPDKPEELDDKDNDCDGEIDEDYLIIDTDLDGVSDYEEYHNYSTNPQDNDSDGDGMPDGYELFISFSDPSKYDYDKDADGFYDFEDCNDLIFLINSRMNEVWNGIDDNCNGEIDEGVVRLDSITANPTLGQQFLWDSGNKSLIITLEGVPLNIERSITWKFENFSLNDNTSSDNLRLFLPPLDCNDIYRTELATHLCTEGNRHQNITIIISDLDVTTELKFDINTSVWIRNSKQDNNVASILNSPIGIMAAISFILIISSIGAIIGLRIEKNKNLKDAYDAFEVTGISKNINRNNALPSAPEIPELMNYKKE